MNNEPSLEAPKPASHRFAHLAISFIFIAAIAYGTLFYGQRVIDMVQARMFTPSGQVAAVTERLNLTPHGYNIFYASDPQVEDKNTFNTNCQSTERTAAILGCYWKRNIHLFDVQNKELDGTLEVTAAHEMLHAAYERLNWIERERVDTLVEEEFQRNRGNAALKQIMQYYAKSEPGAESNELHSIIGTTVADISPELESYYSQYFADRATIVALNTKYNAVFGELNKQADELEAKIKSEGPAIQAELANYEADRQQLELDIQTFNARAQSGGFTTQSAFNVARNALTTRLSSMNARQQAVNARVASYNDLVAQLNALAIRVDQLNASINGASAASGL